ncbi:DUF4214 domain-containing protein [Herbaspirillum sp. HC18]|nr:DUF4214 domain-containing protein [Herbaspirillum sp. HC18]
MHDLQYDGIVTLRRIPASLMWIIFATLALSSCGGGDTAFASTSAKIARADVQKARSGLESSTTVTFAGKRSDYVVTASPVGSPLATDYTVIDNAGHSTSLNVLQRARFSDVTLSLFIAAKAETVAARDLKTLIELYIAFFNRVPDADGLAYWIDQFNSGESIDQIAQSFYSAGLQFSSLTGYNADTSDADFVRIIYKNVLGRYGDTAPSDTDVQYWVGELASGRANKGSLVRTMLASAHSFQGNATWGWVANLLNNKYLAAHYFAITQKLNYNTPEETISNTMAIASAVTPTDISNAISLVQPVDGTGQLPGVTAKVRFVPNIRQNITANQARYMPAVALDVTLTGPGASDFSLSGIASYSLKTVYFVVENPENWVTSRGTGVPTETGVGVTLPGKMATDSGRYTGNLAVFACLDMQCKTRLNGSPFLVPYDITVQDDINIPKGVIPNQSMVSATTTFGKIPGDFTIPVTIPKTVTAWRADTPNRTLTTGTDDGGTTGKIFVSFTGRQPGIYQEMITVWSRISGSSFYKYITVNYTVSPDSTVNYYFYPNPLVVERKYNDSSFKPSNYDIVTNTGLTSTWRGVEYLSAPSTAAQHPRLNSWWSSSDKQTVPCYSSASVNNCLPVGTYKARVHYTIYKDGAAIEEAYLPITMNIVP